MLHARRRAGSREPGGSRRLPCARPGRRHARYGKVRASPPPTRSKRTFYTMRDTREGNGLNSQDFGEPKRRVGAALAWAGALVSRRGLCSLCLVQTSWVGRYVEATPRRLRLNGPASIGKTRDAQDRMVEGAAAAPAPADQKLPEGSQAHRGRCSPNNRATAPSADGGRESPRAARPQPPGIRPRGAQRAAWQVACDSRGPAGC